MSEENKEEFNEERFIRRKIKRHWIIILLMSIAVVTAMIFVFYIFRLFVERTIVGDFGIIYLADFTVRTFILSCLLITVWELLLIVLPTLGFLCLGGGLYWWLFVSNYEKDDLKKKTNKLDDEDEKSSNRKHKGIWGGASGLIFVGMLINLGIKGMWRTPLSSFETMIAVDIWLETVFWIFIIFGIPSLIGRTFWYLNKHKVFSKITFRIQEKVDETIKDIEDAGDALDEEFDS